MEEDVVFKSWFQEKLSDFLGFPAGSEMIDYILAFESAREIEDHLASLLDPTDENTRIFIDQFFNRWSPRLVTAQNAQLYKKSEIASPVVKKKSTKPSYKSPESIFTEERNKSLDSIFTEERNTFVEESDNCKTPPQKMVVDTRGAEFLDKNQLMPCEKKTGSPFKPKHLKYVPLFSADGKVKTDIVLLEGRHPCKCLAQKHKLINNCEQCGRIVCQQEGAGPCMFCGNLVCSREEKEILDRDSKKSRKLHEKLMAQTYVEEEVDPSLQKAIAHKERLLEFDKNCTKRTKVLDDEADYFSDNRWLKSKDREALAKREKELREKKHQSRLDKKFTLDFAGRRVVEDVVDVDIYDYEDEVVQAVMNSGKENNPNSDLIRNNPLIDPRLKVPPPQYQGPDGCVTESLRAQDRCVKECLRVQDKDLQEIVDKGICLSMHQPWATLLVYGIKKLEGRSWYTAHRGRLWIASTAKIPEQEQIRHTEDQYRYLHANEKIEFPKTYPSGALLGCVNLVDCVTSEEYFEKNPDVKEENDSAYLFVCESPEQLKIKFAIKGKHKTYKLEKHVHDAAKKNLLASTCTV